LSARVSMVVDAALSRLGRCQLRGSMMPILYRNALRSRGTRSATKSETHKGPSAHEAEAFLEAQHRARVNGPTEDSFEPPERPDPVARIKLMGRGRRFGCRGLETGGRRCRKSPTVL
jgi:hypothetical protein